MLLDSYTVFFAPGFPLEDIKDPTGAGDVFAGGFVGYLHQSGVVNEKTLRQAVIYGSTLASYACEDFSLNKLDSLTLDDIDGRFKVFRDLTAFEV
jgi:sugar/nucleoside kinase (ribokinase family)